MGDGLKRARAAAKPPGNADLRREIEELRRVGSQMANVCFNVGQDASEDGPARIVNGRDLLTMHRLYREWDSIKRAEVKRQ